MPGLRFFSFIALVGLFSTFGTIAHARSCTEQGKECAAWASGPNASFKAACAREVGACKARCKKGQKFFLGVSAGLQYPIDTCN